MRIVDRRHRVGRRAFLRTASLAVPAAALVSAGTVAKPEAAWANTAESLKPKTAATLTRMARDIYPHDSVPERFYAAPIAALDKKAKDDAALHKLLESGVAELDAKAQAAHRSPYLGIEDEAKRVALLQAAADTAFFKALRSDLIVSFYNQPELWTLFGYEGSSFEHGGYIHRGFDDIDWLPNA